MNERFSMGAVSFSLDIKLVELLKSVLPLDVFLETGTFHGDTVASVQSYFDKIYSIELSESLSQGAIERFSALTYVEVLKGDSPTRLKELTPVLKDKSVLYWLDAHWCVDEDTAGNGSQCPLLNELESIGKLNHESVILIDDARLFLSPPPEPHKVSQWPDFDSVVKKLLSLSEFHQIIVLNDVIIFYPKNIHNSIHAFAIMHGVDWLKITDKAGDYDLILNSAKEKEQQIKLMKSEIDLLKEMHDSQQYTDTPILQAKLHTEMLNQLIKRTDLIESVLIIPQIQKNIRNAQYKRILRKLFWPVKRVREILSPRLGKLNQYYIPKPLSVDTSALTKLSSYPSISIITPSFNQAEFIARTIDSVLLQNYPNLEYFVQDGASTDETKAVLATFEDQLSGWTSEPDNGQSEAINLGFVKTSGEIMAWLNSDDLLLPGAIAKVIDYFNRHPEVDVVYGDRLMIDEQDREIGRWMLPGHDDNVMLWADYIPQETLFWRRSIWEKAGGKIDESFRFAMDWDLIIRFHEVGAKFAHIPQFLGAFRIHEAQKTSSVIHEVGMQEMNRIRERIHGYVPDSLQVRSNVVVFLVKHIFTDLRYRIKTRLRRRKKLTQENS